MIAKFSSYVLYHAMILTSIPDRILGILYYDRIYNAMFNMQQL